MIFLTLPDLLTRIRQKQLDQLTERDEMVLNDAEKAAIQQVRDAIYVLYDDTAIFAATGDARHGTIIRLVLSITIYHIYNRVPDTMMPDTVIRNYDDATDTLTKIVGGKMGLAGAPTRSTTDADGNAVKNTVFRYGSNRRRT